MSAFRRQRVQVGEPVLPGIWMAMEVLAKSERVIHRFARTGIGGPGYCHARRIHRSGGL
jgi:hypothetical protein